jgi:predicted branched-subunit amino acid permease
MHDWRETLSDPQLRRGARDMLVFAPGMAAWGMVTGIAMVNSGLSMPVALAMSLLVYAGSAQLATIPLLAAGAPIGVIWATALCVNLRFVLYSARWRAYFGHLPRWRAMAMTYLSADLNLIVFQRAYPRPAHAPGQVAYFLGGAVSTWLVWQAASMLGIGFAQVIPVTWGLGFAGTLAVLGLTYGLIKERRTQLAALAAAAAAVLAHGLPLKLNILVAIGAAAVVGLYGFRSDTPPLAEARKPNE